MNNNSDSNNTNPNSQQIIQGEMDDEVPMDDEAIEVEYIDEGEIALVDEQGRERNVSTKKVLVWCTPRHYYESLYYS